MERKVLMPIDKPFSYPGFQENMKIYKGAGLTIVTAKSLVNFPEGATHAHGSYEFIFPVTTMESSWMGNRKMSLEQNKLIPINLEQEHGPAKAYSGCNFLSIEVTREFMAELTRAIYGKAEVVFTNDNYTYGSNLQCYINQFVEECQNPQAGSEFILQSLATQFTINVLRQLDSNLPTALSDRNYNERDNINRAIDYLMENFSKEYSLEEVAQEANLSPYYFIKVFKAQTGKTPYDFLVDIKISKACALLKMASKNVTEICHLCGFNNSSHFTNVFKKRIGLSPTEYRKVFVNRPV